MECPNCHTQCGEQDRFCYLCGCELSPVQKAKKGTHLVPILILILLSVAGTVIFFLTRNQTPQAANTDAPWFQVYEGYLYFDESLYTGGTELNVPSQVDGKTVIGLSDGCFENCTDLTTVILPDTLTEINNDAFAGCTALRGIYLPESVYVIGAGAFAGCEALEAITIPAAMRFIGPDTFEGCYALDHIFFDGSFARWTELYDGFIGPETVIHCEDGSFYHSTAPVFP